MVETSSPSHWGCCRSSGRRRSEAGARIPRVGGRNVARAITRHRFGLWAVLEAGREWITALGSCQSGTTLMSDNGATLERLESSLGSDWPAIRKASSAATAWRNRSDELFRGH